MKNKKLLFAFATAVLLRLGYVAAFPPGALIDDSRGYDAIAWNIASGSGFSMEPGVPTPVRAPGFPVFLAAVYLIFGHSPLAAALFQALLGGLCCLLVYDIAVKFAGEREALLAAWLMALSPVPIAYTGLLLSETLFTLLLLSSVALYARSDAGDRTALLAASGALLGLATLTRPTTILFPGAVALALLIAGRGRPVRKFLIFALAFAAAILPWTARNHSRFGVLLPVATGGSTCLYATGVEAEGGTYQQGFEQIAVKWREFSASADFTLALNPDIRFDRELKKEGVQKIKEHPSTYLAVVLKRIPRYWLSSHSSVFGVDKPLGEYRALGQWGPVISRAVLLVFHSAVFLLACLGLYYYRTSLRAWALLPLILVYFNMHALFDMCPRYLVPIFPYLLILCAAAVVRLGAGSREVKA